MKTIKIFISGIVQGIGFRAFIREEADRLGLKGYVRNLDDGRVEVVVEGSEKAIGRIINICRKGAPYSQVKNIEIERLENRGFGEFKILGF